MNRVLVNRSFPEPQLQLAPRQTRRPALWETAERLAREAALVTGKPRPALRREPGLDTFEFKFRW